MIFMCCSYVNSYLENPHFSSGNVAAVQPGETPTSLWGDDMPDPKDALAKEGFQMRRVVLTPKVVIEPNMAEE